MQQATDGQLSARPPGHGHRETQARPGRAGAARSWSLRVTRCAGIPGPRPEAP